MTSAPAAPLPQRLQQARSKVVAPAEKEVASPMRFYLYSYMTAVLLFFVVQGEACLPGAGLPLLPALVADLSAAQAYGAGLATGAYDHMLGACAVLWWCRPLCTELMRIPAAAASSEGAACFGCCCAACMCTPWAVPQSTLHKATPLATQRIHSTRAQSHATPAVLQTSSAPSPPMAWMPSTS